MLQLENIQLELETISGVLSRGSVLQHGDNSPRRRQVKRCDLCDRSICTEVLLGLKEPAVVPSSTVINGSGRKNAVSGQQMSTLHSLITTITSVIS